MNVIERFDRYTDQYEAWYEAHPEIYQSEILAIREHFTALPENIRGIEVGLGTGRFSEPLGIKEGVEPSEAMAAVAISRGIEVVKGKAEHLPYAAIQFHFVLLVTICHLENVRAALKEAHRVLKPGGTLILAFLDRDRPIAQSYIDRKLESHFYRKAKFYTSEELQQMLQEEHFKDLVFNQTLFGPEIGITEVQEPKSGYGEGSFVVVRARKA